MSQGKFSHKSVRGGAEKIIIETPVTESPVRRRERKKKGPARHTKVFYTLYSIWVISFLVLLVVLFGFKGQLDDFLNKFEASQPNARSKEIFQEHFADPDWRAIYEMAQVEGAEFDTVESFVQLMEQQVGGQELSFMETSMGLSEDKKFIVRAGEKNVAAFILRNEKPDANIPQWELLDVEVYYTSNCTVTVNTRSDCTVTVNGKILDDRYVIRSSYTDVQDYLPEGVEVTGTKTYFVDGLMVEPAVEVTDQAGAVVNMTYDAATATYSHTDGEAKITDEQLQALDDATRAYGRFMIADVGKNTLAKYFKDNSYKTITQAELMFVQDNAGYEFEELKVTDYQSYSDTYCGVYFERLMNVTRKNGTVKPNEIMFTCFMEKQNGKWVVVEVSNANVLEDTKTEVRLRFMQDGKVLEDQLLDSKTKALSTPEVTVPQGKKLAGWATQSVNEEGKTVMTVVFQPGEFGDVSLPANYELEPMVLYPVFEKEAQ